MYNTRWTIHDVQYTMDNTQHTCQGDCDVATSEAGKLNLNVIDVFLTVHHSWDFFQVTNLMQTSFIL